MQLSYLYIREKNIYITLKTIKIGSYIMDPEWYCLNHHKYGADISVPVH